MKKIISIILTLISVFLVLTLAGCRPSGVEIPDGMHIASSENDAFYLFVPQSWLLNTSSGTASAYASRDDHSNVSFTCMAWNDEVSDGTLTDSIDKYIDECRSELSKILPGYAAVGEPSSAVMAGKNGKSFDYTAKMDNIEYKFRQIVIKVNGLFYVFTYTSTVEGFDLHTAEVEKITANIRFK